MTQDEEKSIPAQISIRGMFGVATGIALALALSRIAIVGGDIHRVTIVAGLSSVICFGSSLSRFLGGSLSGAAFSPHFSIRTLALVVTLICAYFGAWETTKTKGITSDYEKSPLPFVVYGDREIQRGFVMGMKWREYRIWIFGFSYTVYCSRPTFIY